MNPLIDLLLKTHKRGEDDRAKDWEKEIDDFLNPARFMEDVIGVPGGFPGAPIPINAPGGGGP